MVDALLGFLIAHPAAARALGRGMVTASGALALLAMRLDKVFHRLEVRGVPHPSLEAILPSWVYWAVPESAFGWFVVIAVFVAGVVLALAAKRFERMLR